jgi:NitT/TauT family transport system substrate-binding protein
MWNNYQFNLSLGQSLLFTLDNQARWAIKNGSADRNDLPNFLEAIYVDGLKSVKPDAVRIVK